MSKSATNMDSINDENYEVASLIFYAIKMILV